MLAIKHSHFESWDIWGFNVIKMVNAEKNMDINGLAMMGAQQF